MRETHIETEWISVYTKLDILPEDVLMPLFIKDDATAVLVAELAAKRGITKQEAVRQAVQAELDRIARAIPLRERIAAWRREHPLPPPTGQLADKAFFDELSGET